MLPQDMPTSVVLIEKGGNFFVYEPGLGVVASGSTVSDAYGKFVAARRVYVDCIEQAGLAVSPASPPQQGGELSLRRDVRGELGMFLAKTLIVMLVIGAIFGPIFLVAGRAIERAAGGIGQELAGVGALSLADLSRKTGDIVRDWQDLPEDKKVQLRENLGTISRELTPFLEAWRNPPAVEKPPARPGR